MIQDVTHILPMSFLQKRDDDDDDDDDGDGDGDGDGDDGDDDDDDDEGTHALRDASTSILSSIHQSVNLLS